MQYAILRKNKKYWDWNFSIRFVRFTGRIVPVYLTGYRRVALNKNPRSDSKQTPNFGLPFSIKKIIN